MTTKERKLFEEIWTRFRECLVHTSATPKLIESYEKRVREVLK